MKKFIVLVSWRMSGEYEVEAASKEEALQKAYDITSLPEDGRYIDDSLIYEEDEIQETTQGDISR